MHCSPLGQATSAFGAHAQYSACMPLPLAWTVEVRVQPGRHPPSRQLINGVQRIPDVRGCSVGPCRRGRLRVSRSPPAVVWEWGPERNAFAIRQIAEAAGPISGRAPWMKRCAWHKIPILSVNRFSSIHHSLPDCKQNPNMDVSLSGRPATRTAGGEALKGLITNGQQRVRSATREGRHPHDDRRRGGPHGPHYKRPTARS